MALTITPAINTRINVAARILFASFRLPSPRLLAITAETATLIAIKTDNPTNFGLSVIPTAATASGPKRLTINVSISPATETEIDSKTAGHAISMVFFSSSDATLASLSLIYYNIILTFYMYFLIHVWLLHIILLIFRYSLVCTNIFICKPVTLWQQKSMFSHHIKLFFGTIVDAHRRLCPRKTETLIE